MTENPAPAAESAEAPEVPEQTTGQRAAAKDQSEDFNAARARRQIKSLQKQLEDATSKLSKREEADKSEMQKAIDAAEKRGREGMAAEVQRLRLDHSLETELLRRGLDPDLKHVVLAKAELETEADIAGAVDEVLGKRDWLKPKPIGSPGSPDRSSKGREFPRGGSWDRAQIQEVIARGQYDEYREEIERAYGVRK